MPITSERLTPIDELRQPIRQPSADEFQRVADEITRWGVQYLTLLSEQSVGQYSTPVEMASLLPGDAPIHGRPFDELFAELQERVFPFAFRNNHPRFLAFVPAAPSLASVWGEWLTAITNFYGGFWLEGAGPAHIEKTVLDWFRQWLGFPASTNGVLTSGGSEANLTALVVAREQLSPSERSSAVIYMSAERHWSVDRALRVMGHERIRLVPVDQDYRFDLAQLRDSIIQDFGTGFKPWLVVGTAGATNTGTIDPLAGLAEIASEFGMWFHIDAAYGWSGILLDDEKAAFAGIERADSVTLDPHKWFAQTYESGCLLVRKGHLLPTTFADRPDYLDDVAPKEAETNFADHGISLSRRFRALKIWLAVQSLGVEWHRQLITRCCDLARYAESRLRNINEFEVLCSRQLSIVCFRYCGSNTTSDLETINRQLLNELRDSGLAFLSSTRLSGTFAIRMCFVNGQTTSTDVDRIIDFLLQAGRRAEGNGHAEQTGSTA